MFKSTDDEETNHTGIKSKTDKRTRICAQDFFIISKAVGGSNFQISTATLSFSITKENSEAQHCYN